MGIHPYLERLNNLGIQTITSCSGLNSDHSEWVREHQHMPYICFKMPDNITNIDEREWDPETKEYLNCIKYALLRAGLSDINAGKLFKPILIEGKDSICGYLTWKVNDEAIKRYFEAFIEEIEVLNCSAKRRKVVLFIIF